MSVPLFHPVRPGKALGGSFGTEARVKPEDEAHKIKTCTLESLCFGHWWYNSIHPKRYPTDVMSWCLMLLKCARHTVMPKTLFYINTCVGNRKSVKRSFSRLGSIDCTPTTVQINQRGHWALEEEPSKTPLICHAYCC